MRLTASLFAFCIFNIILLCVQVKQSSRSFKHHNWSGGDETQYNNNMNLMSGNGGSGKYSGGSPSSTGTCKYVKNILLCFFVRAFLLVVIHVSAFTTFDALFLA